MEREVLFETRHLYKTYGRGANKVDAIQDLNLTIYKGETVAIVGKSGSGKSTLMHLLAMLDKPTKGEIILDGRKTKKLRARELNKIRNKKFGFVFQSFYMNANDSVISNVLLPLRIAKTRMRKARKVANTALKIVELDHKKYVKAKNLSGGQKQRVCIARAIVNMPEVIFADEPTGNLDSVTGAKITDLLFRLNKKSGITIIVVTHDEDIAKLCDRQIRIQDGQIVETAGKQYLKRPLNSGGKISRPTLPPSYQRINPAVMQQPSLSNVTTKATIKPNSQSLARPMPKSTARQINTIPTQSNAPTTTRTVQIKTATTKTAKRASAKQSTITKPAKSITKTNTAKPKNTAKLKASVKKTTKPKTTSKVTTTKTKEVRKRRSIK